MNEVLKQRLYYFFWALIMIFFVLVLRLLHVQLIQGEEFFGLAEENRFFTKSYPAERGVILDRYGQVLVKNQENYYRLADGQQLYSQQTLVEPSEGLALMATASAHLHYDFSRHYLYPEAMAHSLGYLSLVTAEDLIENRDLAYDAQLGRMGLEARFNDLLSALPGKEIYEVNALGEKQQLVERTAALRGENLKTSLDPYLSELAYQSLAGKKGAVVLMDAETGKILVLVSSPSFDSNLFEESRREHLLKITTRSAKATLQEALQDERQIFFNRAISGAYPPGSVFKLVTALGALQDQALDAATVVEDEGTLKVGDYEYANWYYTQYGRVEGSVDLAKAIARSNDIYFYKAAEWLGADRLADYAELFNFGHRVGVELGGEKPGLVPRPSWKEEERSERWYLGNTYHFGIGQGDLLVTPLQVAQMTQAIVNQGVLCQARLTGEEGEFCKNLSIDEANFNLILEGMLAAASSGGTAYPIFDYNQTIESELISRLGEETYEDLSAREKMEKGMLLGKTGTAEFGGANEEGYRSTHAWFTSVVGLDVKRILERWELADEQPDEKQKAWLSELEAGNLPSQLVMTVLVESDDEKLYREGSEDAAPVVRALLEWMTGI